MDPYKLLQPTIATFILLLSYPPTNSTPSPLLYIDKPPLGRQIFSGISYYLSCKSRSQTNSTILWLDPHNNTIIKNGNSRINTETHTFSNNSGKFLSTDLIFEPIETEDSGTYSCILTSNSFNLSRNIPLVILPNLYDSNIKRIYTTTTNTNLTLTCHLNKDLNYQHIVWLKDNSRIIPNAKYIISKAKPENLKIIQTSTDDHGDYQCQILIKNTNTSAYITKRNFRVNILYNPQWLNSTSQNRLTLSPFILPINAKLNLSCEAHGYPPPNILWTRHNKILTSDTKIFGNYAKNTLRLTITNEDFGKYKCTALNELGTISKSILIINSNSPPPPPKIKILRIKKDKVLLTITPPINNKIPISGFTVNYMSPTHTGSKTYLHNETQMHILSNLHPGSPYTFTFRSLNNLGHPSNKSYSLVINTPKLHTPTSSANTNTNNKLTNNKLKLLPGLLILHYTF